MTCGLARHRIRMKTTAFPGIRIENWLNAIPQSNKFLCEIYLCELCESSADRINLYHINFYHAICYNA